MRSYFNYQPNEFAIPGYRLVKKLGEGQYGEVWKAEAPGRLPAAIKFVNLTDKKGHVDLKSLKVIRKIQHVHLVKIHSTWFKNKDGTVVDQSSIDFSTTLNDAFSSKRKKASGFDATITLNDDLPVELVIIMDCAERSLMEYLDEYLAAGKPGIPAEDLIPLIEGAAKGIDYLSSPIHDFGNGLVPIIHSDIKPDNILIVSGNAVIGDFGVSTAVDPSRETNTHAKSIAYSAPEKFRRSIPTPKSDQYSLAITYYELRAGKLPFDHDATPTEVMFAHINGTLDFSGVDPLEQPILRRATAVNPNDRYKTCSDFIRRLRRALKVDDELESHDLVPSPSTDEPISAPVPSIAYPTSLPDSFEESKHRETIPKGGGLTDPPATNESSPNLPRRKISKKLYAVGAVAVALAIIATVLIRSQFWITPPAPLVKSEPATEKILREVILSDDPLKEKLDTITNHVKDKDQNSTIESITTYHDLIETIAAECTKLGNNSKAADCYDLQAALLTQYNSKIIDDGSFEGWLAKAYLSAAIANLRIKNYDKAIGHVGELKKLANSAAADSSIIDFVENLARYNIQPDQHAFDFFDYAVANEKSTQSWEPAWERELFISSVNDCAKRCRDKLLQLEKSKSTLSLIDEKRLLKGLEQLKQLQKQDVTQVIHNHFKNKRYGNAINIFTFASKNLVSKNLGFDEKSEDLQFYENYSRLHNELSSNKKLNNTQLAAAAAAITKFHSLKRYYSNDLHDALIELLDNQELDSPIEKLSLIKQFDALPGYPLPVRVRSNYESQFEAEIQSTINSIAEVESMAPGKSVKLQTSCRFILKNPVKPSDERLEILAAYLVEQWLDQWREVPFSKRSQEIDLYLKSIAHGKSPYAHATAARYLLDRARGQQNQNDQRKAWNELGSVFSQKPDKFVKPRANRIWELLKSDLIQSYVEKELDDTDKKWDHPLKIAEQDVSKWTSDLRNAREWGLTANPPRVLPDSLQLRLAILADWNAQLGGNTAHISDREIAAEISLSLVKKWIDDESKLENYPQPIKIMQIAVESGKLKDQNLQIAGLLSRHFNYHSQVQSSKKIHDEFSSIFEKILLSIAQRGSQETVLKIIAWIDDNPNLWPKNKDDKKLTRLFEIGDAKEEKYAPYILRSADELLKKPHLSGSDTREVEQQISTLEKLKQPDTEVKIALLKIRHFLSLSRSETDVEKSLKLLSSAQTEANKIPNDKNLQEYAIILALKCEILFESATINREIYLDKLLQHSQLLLAKKLAEEAEKHSERDNLLKKDLYLTLGKIYEDLGWFPAKYRKVWNDDEKVNELVTKNFQKAIDYFTLNDELFPSLETKVDLARCYIKIVRDCDSVWKNTEKVSENAAVFASRKSNIDTAIALLKEAVDFNPSHYSPRQAAEMYYYTAQAIRISKIDDSIAAADAIKLISLEDFNVVTREFQKALENHRHEQYASDFLKHALDHPGLNKNSSLDDKNKALKTVDEICDFLNTLDIASKTFDKKVEIAIHKAMANEIAGKHYIALEKTNDLAQELIKSSENAKTDLVIKSKLLDVLEKRMDLRASVHKSLDRMKYQENAKTNDKLKDDELSYAYTALQQTDDLANNLIKSLNTPPVKNSTKYDLAHVLRMRARLRELVRRGPNGSTYKSNIKDIEQGAEEFMYLVKIHLVNNRLPKEESDLFFWPDNDKGAPYKDSGYFGKLVLDYQGIIKKEAEKDASKKQTYEKQLIEFIKRIERLDKN